MDIVVFSILPEDCISRVLSFTSPRDACRSSLVSKIFSSASESDIVWERFLPSDYSEIALRSVSPVAFSTKKELYFRLCDHPILIDGGNKSFALERGTGKNCYMLCPRELLIVWGDTPRSWRWTSSINSRFSEVAELLDVNWLEIHGKIDARMLSPKTAYIALFVLKFAHGAHGLDSPPAEVSLKFRNRVSKHTVYLHAEERQRQQRRINMEHFNTLMQSTPALRSHMDAWDRRVPHERDDGWLEIEMGEFFNDEGDDGEVEMSMMEVKSGKRKGGLIIQGIELRPKVCNR